MPVRVRGGRPMADFAFQMNTSAAAVQCYDIVHVACGFDARRGQGAPPATSRRSHRLPADGEVDVQAGYAAAGGGGQATGQQPTGRAHRASPMPAGKDLLPCPCMYVLLNVNIACGSCVCAASIPCRSQQTELAQHMATATNEYEDIHVVPHGLPRPASLAVPRQAVSSLGPRPSHHAC